MFMWFACMLVASMLGCWAALWLQAWWVVFRRGKRSSERLNPLMEAAVKQACASCGASSGSLDEDLGHKAHEVLYHTSTQLNHPLRTAREIARAFQRD